MTEDERGRRQHALDAFENRAQLLDELVAARLAQVEHAEARQQAVLREMQIHMQIDYWPKRERDAFLAEALTRLLAARNPEEER